MIDVPASPVGLTICEDCWVEGPPASVEAEAGAELIVNPSGSPYHRGKGRERLQMFGDRARAYGAHFAFCQPGRRPGRAGLRRAQPALRARRAILARAAQFEEELLLCTHPGRRRSLDRRRPFPTWTRSTRRWSSACATTSARTASATSASASPGGSTRPWSR